MYVGKGKNLKRRICDHHRGGNEKMSTSTFRRSVNKIHGIVAGTPLRDWVRNNCTFASVAIPRPRSMFSGRGPEASPIQIYPHRTTASRNSFKFSTD